MEITDLLNNLGLSKTESKVYLSALETGKSLPKHLAEKAGVKRPTLYEALPRLFEHGLLTETIVGKRRYLVPEDPQIFLDKKHSDLEHIQTFIPQLRALLATSLEKPTIIFYEGIEGLKKTFQDMLREKQPIFEFVGIDKVKPEFEKYLKNYYVPYRVKYNIPLKMMISGSPKASFWNFKNDPNFLREVKTIPKDLFPVPLDCNIYGNNISFSLHRADSEPIGLIIRSKEIATTMRSLFNFVWEKA